MRLAELLLRLQRVHPVGSLVVIRIDVSDRYLEAQGVIRAAGFQKQHGVLVALGETVREDAAGRPRADNDVVVSASHCIRALRRRNVGSLIDFISQQLLCA